ncbi:MAG: phage major capsid protein [Lactobacillus sp.]|jgi:HK97 family phage major capsid protein|nr:phage major capsid protein [Lactobacillus sp.]MCI2032066.1 phage major capsid protein [Lactobacillus sp.]
MPKTVNELNDAWITAGQKVEDLNAKLNVAALDDDFSKEAFDKLKADRDQARDQRDALKDQVAEARAEEVAAMQDKDKHPLDKGEKDLKAGFIKNFKAMMKGDQKVMDMITSDTDEAGNAIGLTIPQDIETAINLLKRQFDALEQYVTVESVGTLSGSRVYEKWSDITPLQKIDEAGNIPDNDDPKLHLVKYLIATYGGITTITNSLLADTADNLMAWLEVWIAKKVVATHNGAIIAAFGLLKKYDGKLENFDDIKTLMNKAIDPALKSTSSFMTNTSGFDILSKVKDAEGRYLITEPVTQPDQHVIGGKLIHEIADKSLPDNADGSHPLGYGDFKEAVTLYNRQNTSLLSTNIGAGAFETNTTKVRVLDRFDVQVTDDEAAVWTSFTAIADQTGTDPKA